MTEKLSGWRPEALGELLILLIGVQLQKQWRRVACQLRADENQTTFQLLVETIVNFWLDLIEGTSKLVAERGMDNSAAEEIPPVLPI